MKNLFLILLLFCSQANFSQATISEVEKIENFIKVWGLLKYQHPEVSRGKADINNEFIEKLEMLPGTAAREEFNSQLLEWVKSFGTADLRPKKDWGKKRGLFRKNADFRWIANSGFSKELEDLLLKIRNNTNHKDHYASVNRWTSSVEFDNDLPLEDFDVQNKAHRLLFLSHFWNAMKYWNVNIYLTNTPWSKVLPEMIPEFSIKDPSAFEEAKEKLFSKLNDSHSNYYKSKSLNSLTYYPNFGGRIINDTLVINRFFDEKLTREDNISLGDVIYSVEGMGLKDYYSKNFSEVISVSNRNYLKTVLENSFLLASDKDSIRVGIYRKSGQSGEQYIRLSKPAKWHERYTRSQPLKMDSRKLISQDIGYLNLHHITKDELKTAFQDFGDTKGIILDLRNYPRNISVSSLPGYLYPNNKQFVEVLTPFLPAYGQSDTKAALRILKDPFSVGRKNKDYYKGKVILLVDRRTLSNAEWIGMAIQAAPNVITVGEQTGGAVLNRNGIVLMDGTSIDFTKAGAFYPGGENAQRNGLKIDIEVQECAQNYDKDLYLKTAVKLIETNSLL